MSSQPAKHSRKEIQDWLVNRLARLLKVEPGQIDTAATFDRLGLDSATAVGITLDLEDYLGRDVDPETLYEYSTVERLSAHLAEMESGTGAS